MKIEDDVLAGLIDINSRVLDVGCGDGSLLLHLKKNKRVDGRGIEIDQIKVQESVAKGLAVIEGDAVGISFPVCVATAEQSSVMPRESSPAAIKGTSRTGS